MYSVGNIACMRASSPSKRRTSDGRPRCHVSSRLLPRRVSFLRFLARRLFLILISRSYGILVGACVAERFFPPQVYTSNTS